MLSPPLGRKIPPLTQPAGPANQMAEAFINVKPLISRAPPPFGASGELEKAAYSSPVQVQWTMRI
jgi:hypothetical protein